jgi:hypothetical protein
MGTEHKEKVQFVISHLEGCSGNFLGYLAANVAKPQRNIFRVDTHQNDLVLGVNGRTTWYEELDSKFSSHTVIVTHNYNQTQIQETFPNARLIQLYPYTHIGNVLYNVSHKKLDLKLKNHLDNYFLDINIWFSKIKNEEPDYLCNDYWCLRDKSKIENLLGMVLSPAQQQFFDQYWNEQLDCELDMPHSPMNFRELVAFWKIENKFSKWLLAWTIFVYEQVNGLKEDNRLWTINDDFKFDSWDTAEKIIDSQYETH